MNTANQITFGVVYDQDTGCYIVRERACHYSFSNVPKGFTVEFVSKAQAYEQVRRLTKWQEKGHIIELEHMDTPGAFEAVADKKYGAAW